MVDSQNTDFYDYDYQGDSQMIPVPVSVNNDFTVGGYYYDQVYGGTVSIVDSNTLKLIHAGDVPCECGVSLTGICCASCTTLSQCQIRCIAPGIQCNNIPLCCRRVACEGKYYECHCLYGQNLQFSHLLSLYHHCTV